MEGALAANLHTVSNGNVQRVSLFFSAGGK